MIIDVIELVSRKGAKEVAKPQRASILCVFASSFASLRENSSY